MNAHVALITGSTQGLGAVIAEDLAQSGSKVAIHGRRKDVSLRSRVISYAGSNPERVHFIPFDVTDAAAVQAGVDRIESELGGIDILIDCASQFETARIDALDADTWNSVLQTTLTGTFNVCQAVLPRMRARGRGRVILFGCVGCERVYHGTHAVPYRIAASGNLALTKAYAQLAFPDGVTVNMIAPGFLENTTGHTDPATLPAGRYTKLEEILPTVRYLLSDEAVHVSGAMINVAGGYVT